MSMGWVPVGEDHLSFGRLMSPAKPLPRQDLELILEHTAPLREEVRCSRIFLTGGPGSFGCWLVERFCFVNNLLGLGAVATILTRNPEAFAQKCPHLASDRAVTLHAGDVRSCAFLRGSIST